MIGIQTLMFNRQSKKISEEAAELVQAMVGTEGR